MMISSGEGIGIVLNARDGPAGRLYNIVLISSRDGFMMISSGDGIVLIVSGEGVGIVLNARDGPMGRLYGISIYDNDSMNMIWHNYPFIKMNILSHNL